MPIRLPTDDVSKVMQEAVIGELGTILSSSFVGKGQSGLLFGLAGRAQWIDSPIFDGAIWHMPRPAWRSLRCFQELFHCAHSFGDIVSSHVDRQICNVIRVPQQDLPAKKDFYVWGLSSNTLYKLPKRRDGVGSATCQSDDTMIALQDPVDQIILRKANT